MIFKNTQKIVITTLLVLGIGAPTGLTAAAAKTNTRKTARKKWFFACCIGDNVNRVVIAPDKESHEKPAVSRGVIQLIDDPAVTAKNLQVIAIERELEAYNKELEGPRTCDTRAMPITHVVHKIALPPQSAVFQKAERSVSLRQSTQELEPVSAVLPGMLPPIKGYKRPFTADSTKEEKADV